MAENVSNKCKNEEGKRTHNDEIALCSMGSMHSEPQIIAPDGGWGWVIVLASFFLHLIIIGISYTFGMFLDNIMETFGTSRSATSMIGSIQMGVTYLVGPIAADLVNRFGCRVTVIAGSIISATSCIISGVAQNIATLFITKGFFTGLGFGLIYLPAITGVAAYFDKKRAMAIGIASSGAGFGTFIFAPVRNLLNENFGWSWTLMLNGALVIFCIPLGLLFKPIKAKKSHQSTETCEETDGGGELGNTQTAMATINCCGCISACVTKMGKGYIDLLYDAKFILFMLSNLLTNIGFAVPFAYTMDRAVIRGIESVEASFLLSIIGLSSIFGRIGLSALSDHPCINRMYLYTICLIISGMSLMMSNFCFDYLAHILYCIAFGITFGAELGMTSVVLIDVIGLSKFIIGWGIQLFFRGIGLLIGPPIIGALYEATGHHETGFYFAGAVLLMSGLLVFFLNGIKHLREKEERVTQNNHSEDTNNCIVQEKTWLLGPAQPNPTQPSPAQ